MTTHKGVFTLPHGHPNRKAPKTPAAAPAPQEPVATGKASDGGSSLSPESPSGAVAADKDELVLIDDLPKDEITEE